MKRSKSEIQKKKERAQKVFNEYIRLKMCYETTGSPWSGICVTCKTETNNDGHLVAGHFVKDSKNGNLTSFDEHNVHIQCQKCNRYYSGNDGEHAIYIIDKYGREELDRLKTSKAISKKWTIDELESIYKDYKYKIDHWYDERP